MSESEKPKENGGEIPVFGLPDPHKERRGAGFFLLFVACALILGASTPERAGSGSAFWEGLRLFGFFPAGAGAVLVKTPRSVCIALVTLVALNYFVVDADWWHVGFPFLAGVAAVPLFLLCAPSMARCILREFARALIQFFPKEYERKLARCLVLEFAPTIALVVCVIAMFGLLGLTGEILTVGILAVFAWLGKMENHYGSPDYGRPGVILPDPYTGKRIVAWFMPVFTFKAFAPETEEEGPNRKINVGLAGYDFGPLYFCVTMSGFPEGWTRYMDHSIYKFRELVRLIRDTQEIMEEELKSRNVVGGLWHVSWQGWVSKGNLCFTKRSVRGVDSGILLALVNLYFWHLIRYGCPFWPRIVRPIGQNVARIFYFFYKSDTIARETTHTKYFWL